jgi:hypothetical protein
VLQNMESADEAFAAESLHDDVSTETEVMLLALSCPDFFDSLNIPIAYGRRRGNFS